METSSVRFQISANTDEQERTAVVKFTADNLAPTEITIVQAGQTAGKELTFPAQYLGGMRAQLDGRLQRVPVARGPDSRSRTRLRDFL